MKDLFPEFNTPSSKEFKVLWENAVFVFDTNVLLQLCEITNPDVISVLKTLSKEGRVWLPYQVAHEFYAELPKKRSNFILNRKGTYESVIKSLDDAQDKILERPLSKEVCKKIKGSFNSLKKEIEATMPPAHWLGDDTERELNQIFKGKVGSGFKPDKLKTIYKEGKERYAQKIPPGYEDDEKPGTSKYGDLVIWHQTIEMAASNKKPIILITNEKKEDWWWTHSKGRIIGPRPALRREMKDKAGVEFYMYRLDMFMESANKYLGAKFDESSIEQAKSSSEKPEMPFEGGHNRMPPAGWGVGINASPPNLRHRNLNYLGYPSDPNIVNAVWGKASLAYGYPEDYRRDACGALIKYSDYGRGGIYGWEIDHIVPISRGGTSTLNNLQPLHWENNRHKADNYPNWSCYRSS